MTRASGAVLFFLSLWAALPAAAGIGDVDPLYGGGGSYFLPFGRAGAVVLPDGGLLSAHVHETSLILEKTSSTGWVDTAFGTNGRRTLHDVVRRAEGAADATAATALEDGSAYFAFTGQRGSDAYLLRLTPAGDVDPRFGDSGSVRIPVSAIKEKGGAFARVEALAPQPGGGVLALVSAYRDYSPYGCVDALKLIWFDARGSRLIERRLREYSDCLEPLGTRLKPLAHGAVAIDPPTGASGGNLEIFGPTGDTLVLPDPLRAQGGAFASLHGDAAGAGNYMVSASPGGEELRVMHLSPELVLDPGFGSSGNGVVRFPLPPAPVEVSQVDLFVRRGSPYLYALAFHGSAGVQVARLHADGNLDTRLGDEGYIYVPGDRWGFRLQGEQADGGLLLAIAYSSVIRTFGLDGFASPGVIALDMPQGGNQWRAGSDATIRIVRALGSAGAVSVSYSVEGVNTVPPAGPGAGELFWGPDESGAVELRIPVPAAQTQRALAGGAMVRLHSPTGGVLLLGSSVQASILAPPTPAVVSTNAPKGDGGGGAAGPLALLLLTLLVGALRPGMLGAAGVTLDPGFGQGGHIEYASGASRLAAAPEGNLLLVTVESGDLAVARFNPDGQPDGTWASGGVVYSRLSALEAAVRSVRVIDSGGAWVGLAAPAGAVSLPISGGVEIISRHEATLLRIDSAGVPDASFGVHGMVKFDFSAVDGANQSSIVDMAAAPDGGAWVLVAYYRDSYECALGIRIHRLRRDGSSDALFGSAGMLPLVEPDFCYWGGPRLLPLGGGDLLVSSTRTLLRLDAQGRASPIPEVFAQALSGAVRLAAARDRGYVYTATARIAEDLELEVARWHDDLSLDTTFGGAGTGRVTLHFMLRLPDVDYRKLALLVPQGDEPYLYLFADVTSALGGQLIVRLDRHGAVDSTFGFRGTWLTDLYLEPLDQQADGAVVVGISGREAVRLTASPIPSPGRIDRPLSCDYPNSIQGGASGAPVVIRRSLGTQGPVEFDYRAVGAGASRGLAPVTGTIGWADGEEGAKQILIPLEDFTLSLERRSGNATLSCAEYRILAAGIPAAAPTAQAAAGSSPAHPVGGGGAIGGGLPVILLLLSAARALGAQSRSRNR